MRTNLVVCIALLVTAGPARAEPPAKPLETTVVLISHTVPGLDHAQGTGFIASALGLIVTADHVIVDESSGEPHKTLFARRFTGSDFEDFKLLIVKRFRRNKRGRDIAILQVANPRAEPLPYLLVGGTPPIGSEIFIAGFPKVFDTVYPFPLVRRGIIASTRYNYEDGPVLIMDLPGVSGFSGSPVLEAVSGMVVGVFRGSPKNSSGTDFSVAFTLMPQDIPAP